MSLTYEEGWWLMDHETAEETVTAESLIEEVSIDGMCGVY